MLSNEITNNSIDQPLPLKQLAECTSKALPGMGCPVAENAPPKACDVAYKASWPLIMLGDEVPVLRAKQPYQGNDRIKRTKKINKGPQMCYHAHGKNSKGGG